MWTHGCGHVLVKRSGGGWAWLTHGPVEESKREGFRPSGPKACPAYTPDTGSGKTRPQFTFSSTKQGQQPSCRVAVRIGNDAAETPLWDFRGSTVDTNLPANTGDVVWSPVHEGSTCHGASKPRAMTSEAHPPGACDQQEKALPWEAYAPGWRVPAPTAAARRPAQPAEPLPSNEDPAQPAINKQLKIKKQTNTVSGIQGSQRMHYGYLRRYH